MDAVGAGLSRYSCYLVSLQSMGCEGIAVYTGLIDLMDSIDLTMLGLVFYVPNVTYGTDMVGCVARHPCDTQK